MSNLCIYTTNGYKEFLDSNPQQWGAQKHKKENSKIKKKKED